MIEISVKIDKNGNWFINNEPVKHEGIALFLTRSVVKENTGYYLKIKDEKIPIEVEDTPYIVKQVMHRNGKFFLLLNDGTTELLNPSTLEVGRENILYCKIKEDARARFSRPAYYQIAEHIRQDSEGYFIIVEGKKFYIKV
jgi:hypothetical protein